VENDGIQELDVLLIEQSVLEMPNKNFPFTKHSAACKVTPARQAQIGETPIRIVK
jgi:hypothetical protein